ncbi:MAG: InlB B-repeat-containing protein [Bacilli bacterium]|nr:InlB B-repeat-containing protein [Bacilli bacterium]
MNKKLLIIILLLATFTTIGFASAYFSTSSNMKNKFETEDYNLKINGSGGTYKSFGLTINNGKATLPTPTKSGYTFQGYSNSKNGDILYSVNINNVDDINDKEIYAQYKTITYSISYDLNGGSISGQKNNYNVEDTITLPNPTRKGYTFTGWTGTGLSSPTKNVTISKGSTGNRSYKANWSVNYYTVNYYVNNSLWATRSVAYNSSVENLNAQSSLDIYHTFHGWSGWVDKMPDYNINLYANITESYCALITGHGPYGNAQALLNVFKSAGWSGRIEEAPSAPGNYWVVTDYTLTRAQADIQRNYIANNTNYTNYNYPYLYWVAVDCTNGVGDTWTRSLGQKTFKSQY